MNNHADDIAQLFADKLLAWLTSGVPSGFDADGEPANREVNAAEMKVILDWLSRMNTAKADGLEDVARDVAKEAAKKGWKIG